MIDRNKNLKAGSITVRHYIMDIIYRNPMESIKLPSSNELSKKFGVARSTVTLLLKELIDNGYLVGKKGVGTFTAHQNLIPVDGQIPPLVGLLAGDGRYFYYPHQVWSAFASGATALTSMGWNVRPLTIAGGSEVNIAQEILDSKIDALMWFDTSPARLDIIQYLMANGLKEVVYFGKHCSEPELKTVNCVGFDWHSAGEELGKELIRNQCSKLFWIFENPVTAELRQGIEFVCKKAGYELKIIKFDWSKNMVYEYIKEQLSIEQPDAVYIHGEHFSTISRMLKDLKSEALIIAEAHTIRTPFTGIKLEIPFGRLGEQMASQLCELFKPSPNPPKRTLLKIKMLNCGST